MTDVVSVYVTAPSVDVARALARRLLEDELVACANVLPGESLYLWEGDLEEEAEVVMFLKTRRELADDVVGRVEDVHPYDVPAAVVLPLEGGSVPYLDWVRDVTRG